MKKDRARQHVQFNIQNGIERALAPYSLYHQIRPRFISQSLGSVLGEYGYRSTHMLHPSANPVRRMKLQET